MFREGERLTNFSKVDKELIDIKAFLVTVTNGDTEGSTQGLTRVELNLQNCDLTGIDKSLYRGNPDTLGPNAKCVDLKETRTLEGHQGSSKWSYIQIEVQPCDKEPSCITKLLSENDYYHGGTNFLTYRTAFHRMKKLELVLSYSDSTVNAENFDNPIAKVINSQTRIRLDIQKRKFYDFFMGSLTVTTKYGVVYPFQRVTSSYYMADNYHDSTHRQPGYSTLTLVSDDKDKEQKPDPYSIIRIQASAHINQVEIAYPTLVDAFGNIGGVSEALVFIMVLFVFFHSDIRYEQRLLNEGLLEMRKEEARAQAASRNKQKIAKSLNDKVKSVQVTDTLNDGTKYTYSKTYIVSILVEKY